MYVSKERVIRDGYLIAHEGEEMSEEEAARRGLLAEEKPSNEEPEAEANDAPEEEAEPEAEPEGEPEDEPEKKPKRKPRCKAAKED